jgi:sialidase-1
LRTIADVPGAKEKNPVALAQGLAGSGEVTYNNPVAIADRRTGAVHFLFCLEYMRAFYLRSEDDGKSFSPPVEITNAFEGFRADYPNWRVLAIGPGHGIQLRNGRLLASVWLSTGTGGHAHRPSVAGTIYSDDGGRTWKAGGIAIPNTADFVNPSEATVAELSDGRVMFNGRTEAKQRRRVVAVSGDGAAAWSAPRFDEALLEPVCFGSLIRLGRKRLAFVNPASTSRRENLTLRWSEDNGATWSGRKVLEPGAAGYADLAVDQRGNVWCLFEAGTPITGLDLAVIELKEFARSR